MKNLISIVVPTLNEAGSIAALLLQIDRSLTDSGLEYEVIVIDDHSTDETREIVKKLTEALPVKLHLKQDKPGKAFSIMEGIGKAKGDLIAMIDADLQYPPAAIPAMVKDIRENRADVVVANRVTKQTSITRKLSSFVFKNFFGRLLHGLSCDVQSGLKVFRKQIFEEIQLSPSPWTFDLGFLVKARERGYVIGSHDIVFSQRINGETKVDMIKSSWEIAWAALKQKFEKSGYVWFKKNKGAGWEQGFFYRDKKYMTYSSLSKKDNAHQVSTLVQKFVVALIFGMMAGWLWLNWHQAIVGVIAAITALYFVDLMFNLWLVWKSLVNPSEVVVGEKELAVKREWPKYTIFCPLYKEAQVIPQFTKAMKAMNYPKDKLEVQLLLEEDDKETVDAARKMRLPDNFKILVVPDSQPKTKPKACNYGLQQATGEYSVIYDAEDIPDPDQLKKVVIAFEGLPKEVACVQAKLNFYNSGQNLLTRLFTLEYSLWFNLVLPGLQAVGAPIPLGGTSNHFRVKDLIALEGWDPFNVTEDADLGMRIVKRGFVTSIVDSTTYEEANSNYGNWVRQRSRWIKGYMQTYLVHMRRPGELIRPLNRFYWLTFQLVIGGKILSMLINPFLWMLTFAYFANRANWGGLIESFFPPVVYYIGTLALIFGNFLYIYYYMIGAGRRNEWWLVKYAYLVPVYWLAMSWAAVIGLRDLIIRPHHWQKTVHGLHLEGAGQEEKQESRDIADEKQPQRNISYVLNYISFGNRQ